MYWDRGRQRSGDGERLRRTTADPRVRWLLSPAGRKAVEGGGPYLPGGRLLPRDVGAGELDPEWEDAVSQVIYRELPAFLARNPERFLLSEDEPDRAHLANNARLRAGQRMVSAIVARRRLARLDAPVGEEGDGAPLVEQLVDHSGLFDAGSDDAARLEAGFEQLDQEELARFLSRCEPLHRESYRLRACEGVEWIEIAAGAVPAGDEDAERVSRRMRKRYSRLVARAPRGLMRFFEAGGCPCNFGRRCALMGL